MSDPRRRCIATGQIQEKDALLRFVLSPDREVVHDMGKDLPGRGIWVSCDRKAVDLAVKKRLFARAAKGPVTVPDDLGEKVDQKLARHCLSLLGLARKGGQLTVGFSKVEKALASRKAALLIAASDGAEDGRQKLKRIAGDLPVIDIFSNAELGQALGRENLVHACLGAGQLSARTLAAARRLAEYRAIIPLKEKTGVSE